MNHGKEKIENDMDVCEKLVLQKLLEVRNLINDSSSSESDEEDIDNNQDVDETVIENLNETKSNTIIDEIDADLSEQLDKELDDLEKIDGDEFEKIEGNKLVKVSTNVQKDELDESSDSENEVINIDIDDSKKENKTTNKNDESSESCDSSNDSSDEPADQPDLPGNQDDIPGMLHDEPYYFKLRISQRCIWRGGLNRDINRERQEETENKSDESDEGTDSESVDVQMPGKSKYAGNNPEHTRNQGNTSGNQECDSETSETLERTPGASNTIEYASDTLEGPSDSDSESDTMERASNTEERTSTPENELKYNIDREQIDNNRKRCNLKKLFNPFNTATTPEETECEIERFKKIEEIRLCRRLARENIKRLLKKTREYQLKYEGAFDPNKDVVVISDSDDDDTIVYVNTFKQDGSEDENVFVRSTNKKIETIDDFIRDLEAENEREDRKYKERHDKEDGRYKEERNDKEDGEDTDEEVTNTDTENISDREDLSDGENGTDEVSETENVSDSEAVTNTNVTDAEDLPDNEDVKDNKKAKFVDIKDVSCIEDLANFKYVTDVNEILEDINKNILKFIHDKQVEAERMLRVRKVENDSEGNKKKKLKIDNKK